MCCRVGVDNTIATSDEPTPDAPQHPESSVTSTFSADSFEHSYVSRFLLSCWQFSSKHSDVA